MNLDKDIWMHLNVMKYICTYVEIRNNSNNLEIFETFRHDNKNREY